MTNQEKTQALKAVAKFMMAATRKADDEFYADIRKADEELKRINAKDKAVS